MFDSGVGGLGVWGEIVRSLPAAHTIYLADQAHAPYGNRPVEEIRALALAAAGTLLAEGAMLVVMACNTASAAALASLRSACPGIPVVGMEPAVKPAAAATRSGVVGILATRATLEAPGFAALVRRHAGTTRVVTRAGEGLVDAVESGCLDGPEVTALVRACVGPLLSAGADHIVLGCTHYPFLRAVIQRVAGAGVTLIDPAPAVARQVARVWEAGGFSAGSGGASHRLLTTGDSDAFRDAVERLVPGVARAAAVVAATGGGRLARQTQDGDQKT